MVSWGMDVPCARLPALCEGTYCFSPPIDLSDLSFTGGGWVRGGGATPFPQMQHTHTMLRQRRRAMRNDW
jgi:hypothetical protein